MEDIVDTSIALAQPPTSSAAHLQPPPSSPPPPHDMFSSIFYFLAPSLPVGRRAAVDALLREYGGEAVSVQDEQLTTVIAPHGAMRWEGWDVVEEREQEGKRIDVVTDIWVDRSVLLGKLQSPQHYSIEPALIFSGVIACAAASDFSVSDLEVLAAGIMALGGQWRAGLTRDVTHLFALKTGTPKYETALHFQPQTGVTILVPHWFDDSVRLGGGLPTAEYEWPEPKVLHRGLSAVDDKRVKRAAERDTSNDTALSALTPPLPEEEQMRRNVFTSSAYTPAAQARSSVENGTLELGVAGINPYTRLSPGGTALELPSPRTSPYPLSQPLKGKRILISRNLGLSGGRLGALHAQITRAGGTLVRFEGDSDEHESEEPSEDGDGGGWTVSATFRPGERGYKPLLAHPYPPSHAGQEKPITRIIPRLPPSERARRRAELAAVGECDVMIARWRWGAAYVRALRERKTVATLAWLFFLLMPVNAPGPNQNGAGTVVSARPAPTEQLLHYPVPKGLVEGFEKHVVTVTNYTGEAREYLKKLITAMGGTFTPSMSGQNTVLIAAYIKGTKAEKARAWSIPVVNHTWLEDCFAQWRNLTVALEKYIVFPPGVDFSTLLGSRGVFVGAGKHPVPGTGLGTMSAAAAEQHEAELGRLEAEAEELLEDYDELADKWEKEQRVEKRRNADGMEEWIPVIPSALPTAEEEEESQLAQPGGTEAEMKEVAHDLIEVHEDDDVEVGAEVDEQASPAHGRRSSTQPSPAAVKVKATAIAQSKPSPPRPGTSKTKSNGKEKETAKAKAKPKATVVDVNVLDFSSSESEPEVDVAKQVKKGPPTSAKKTTTPKKPAKAVVPEDEEEGSDFTVEVVPAKKSAKSKAPSPAKPVSKSKKKVIVSSDEDHADEQADDVVGDDGVMEVDSSKAKSKSASKAAKPSAPSKSKPSVAEEEQEDESMDDDRPVPTFTPNGKSKSAAGPVVAGSSKKESEKETAPAFPSSSLLARPKADARTRVVRRAPRESVAETAADAADAKPSKKKKILVEESDDSDEVIVSKPKGKGKEFAATKAQTKPSATKDTKKPAPKPRGRARVIDTPQSEDEVEQEQEPPPAVDSEPEPEPDRSPPRKKLVRRATAERPTATSKPVSKPTATRRSKDTYVESDGDSDNTLPEASHILRSDKRAADEASKPKSKGKAKEPTVKVKPSAGTKSKPNPVETGTDEDSEPSVITVKPKSKHAAKPTATTNGTNAVSGPSTPKRTVSVLMPSLNLSGKPKSAPAKETSKPKPTSKAKKPVSEEPENEEHEEDEVTNLISPKLARTGSLRVASGHLSTPSSSAVVKKSNKQGNSRRKRTADEALSSGEEDTRRMPPPPQASTSANAGPLPRRTAAAKASERLRNQIMPDVIAYESQKRRAAEQARKGRVSMDAFKVAGEGSLEELRVQPNSSQSQTRNGKRSSQSDEDEDRKEEEKPVKRKRRANDEVEVVMVRRGKAKTDPPTEVNKEVPDKPSIHIMTTQVTLSDEVLRALLKLGIKMTSRAGECTHLIAKQVVRTEKFLCAVAGAPWVVTEAWALNCVAEKRVLPEKNYLLRDKAGEDKYGVRLADALCRAEQLKGSLFKGHTFYVTKSVPVDSKLLKNVVNACGGQVSTQAPTVRIISTAPDTRHVVSCADDISTWRPLANAGINVYTQELLLNGALRQEVDYDSDEFLLKA